MSKIVIKNGSLVLPEKTLDADLILAGGSIVGTDKTADNNGAAVIDATSCWVTPGLIDLQVNGGPACDFWGEPTVDELHAFGQELAAAGVTTIYPTLITAGIEHLRGNIRRLEAMDKETLPVFIPGLHLEGPFLSPQRPGVHPVEHIQPLNMEILTQLMHPLVKLITLAPEKDETGECVKYLQKQGIAVALGHSNATYDEARAAFDGGVKLMTHTYNALPPIHHRDPGAVVAAMLDDRVVCCLICDGQHVSAPAAHLLLKVKGVNRVILVTDVAHIGTSQGGLVGSSILLDTAVRNVVDWKIATFAEAILMSTYNPAKALGLLDITGEIAAGKRADIVVWDKDNLAIKHVFVGGRQVFPAAQA